MSEAERLARFDFRALHVEDEKKEELSCGLKRLLGDVKGIIFAYVHGGFVELKSFRDLDVAIWIEDPENAFDYTVNLSAKLEAELRIPVDIHGLNNAPLPFKRHVFVEGMLLLSADEEFRLRILDETLRLYFDLKELNKADVHATQGKR